ncbi:hypothetical protein TNCT_10731 [Trichonephila clavata]|uniref:Uncharacterized protein n=1 Tax=Trichonephila clavata TaxID=2740835 RepID=A0A8X6L3S4_TRICU|nr:hypothetical protein TNCT_10731 [Trichonephila clavata]
MKDAKAGDACLEKVKVNGVFKFLLGCVYIHPGTALAEIKLFVLESLLKYSKSIAKDISDYDPDLTTPIRIVGDFNVNISQNCSLPAQRVQFVLHPNFSRTALGNISIDILSIDRNLDVSCMPLVSYFSYHRPIINKVIL